MSRLSWRGSGFLCLLCSLDRPVSRAWVVLLMGVQARLPARLLNSEKVHRFPIMLFIAMRKSSPVRTGLCLCFPGSWAGNTPSRKCSFCRGAAGFSHMVGMVPVGHLKQKYGSDTQLSGSRLGKGLTKVKSVLTVIHEVHIRPWISATWDCHVKQF